MQFARPQARKAKDVPGCPPITAQAPPLPCPRPAPVVSVNMCHLTQFNENKKDQKIQFLVSNWRREFRLQRRPAVGVNVIISHVFLFFCFWPSDDINRTKRKEERKKERNPTRWQRQRIKLFSPGR